MSELDLVFKLVPLIEPVGTRCYEEDCPGSLGLGTPNRIPFNRPHIGRASANGGSHGGLPVKNLVGNRADAQPIVATRLLYSLHDPTEQPSRMQGIYPRAR